MLFEPRMPLVPLCNVLIRPGGGHHGMIARSARHELQAEWQTLRAESARDAQRGKTTKARDPVGSFLVDVIATGAPRFRGPPNQRPGHRVAAGGSDHITVVE